MKSQDVKIQIGMSIAKVSISREWFNPGVFLLTKDMYNTSSKKIAPDQKGKPFQDARFNAMNECVFPCFPVAFIIARDVTIKFSSNNAMSSSFAQSVEDHSASGGGFFIFGGSSSSSSSSARSNSRASSTANSVTVRFTSPQILGYYLRRRRRTKAGPSAKDATPTTTTFPSWILLKTSSLCLTTTTKPITGMPYKCTSRGPKPASNGGIA